MANASIVLLALLMLAIGGGGGWYARGVVDGSVVTATDVAAVSQQAVDAGVQADREITAARTETETAVERVRVVTRTVEVAADCPPGRGPVSFEFAQQLRALADARGNPDAGASRVP